MVSLSAEILPRNDSKDSFLVIFAAGLFTHFVYNRWEPTAIPTVVGFFVLLPCLLAPLLVPHYGLLTGVFLSFATFFTTLSTSIVLYRISPFHPLARYPGPLACKISKLWMVKVVKTGKQQLYISSLHEKYGDIVRIGPNDISIRNASCIVPQLGSQGLPKGPAWAGRSLHNPIPALIGSRDPVEHARRRRPWNRAFNTTALKEYEPIITKRVGQLSDYLSKQKGVVDLAQWISFFTYDFMGDMVFGGGTEMMRDGDKDGLWQALRDGMDMAQIYENIPWLSIYTKHMPGVGNDLKQFRAMATGRAAERHKNGSMTKDLFYYLSNEDGAEKESPSRSVVLSDGVLALVAGSDTTASVLSNVFWSLVRHPDMYKRLQEEVDKYYPPGEDALNPKHHSNMPYLESVINETLRLYPVTPSGSQRAPQLGKGGKLVGPYYLPQGTSTRLNNWSIHRDPRNFSYPEEFYPDRWMIAEGLQESKEKLVHNPNAFIPFSFGPANCVGKNLAQQEMRVVVCQLVQKFTMRFPEGWDPMKYEREMEDRFVIKLGELPMILQRRD